MSALEKIHAALAVNPSASASDLALSSGVSRQRVHQICKAEGIVIADRRRREGRAKQWETHFGGGQKLSSLFVGGASELTAAADLLRRGIPVYRAVTFASAADLVIDKDGALLRIEVRSAKRSQNGALRYPMPADRARYDILALVEPDGKVTYKPDV